MALFAFTTLVGNLFYVNQAWAHLFRRTPSKLFNYVYYTVAAGLILLGAGLSADLLWNLADLLMGLMALINIPVILILGGQAYRALKDYRRQKKQGLDPVFRAKDIGIEKPLDYWK